jgi:excisionase family DNA binding protein
MDRLLYRVPEAAELLGVSRAFLYREIAAGRLKPVKLGVSTRIPAEELRRYVEHLKRAPIGSRAHEEDASS